MFLFVNVGFPSTAFGVYQPYLVELPGMNHALASTVVSVRALVALLATFLVARYYRRLDCRLGVTLGTIFTAIGFLIFAFAKTFPVLAVAAAFAGLGYGLGGAVGMTLLVGRWFKDDVGKAAGFAAMGSGAAGAIIPIFAVRIVEGFGLTASFLFESVLAFAIAGMVFALLRNRPEDRGATPHVSHSLERKTVRREGSVELPRILHALLIVSMVGIGASAQAAVMYISILFTSSGASEVFAATLLSIVGLMLCIGKISTGAVMDAAGTKKGSLLFFAILVAGLVLCCLAPLNNAAVSIAAACLFGLGASLGSTGISVWSIEFSHFGNRAKVARDFQSAYMVGGFLFSLIPGFLAELTGTYVTTYASMAVFALVSMVVVGYVYRHIGERTEASK